MATHEDRGTQISLTTPKQAGLAFQFPEDPPIDGDGIVELEELIARLRAWKAPFEALVHRVRGYERALRKDVDKAADARIEDRPNPLFDGDDEAEAA